MSKRNRYSWKHGNASLKDHSKIKFRVLEDYLYKYILVRCKDSRRDKLRIAILDGFCGGGIYNNKQDESEIIYGSPVIFVDTVIRAANEINIKRKITNMRSLFVECLIVLNDTDEHALRSVKEQIEKHTDTSLVDNSFVEFEVIIHKGEFEKCSSYLVKEILKRKYPNVICNLDQYGSSDVLFPTIQFLLGIANSVEIFLTFSISAFVNHLRKDDPEDLKRKLEKLGAPVDDSYFDVDQSDREEWLMFAEGLVFDFFNKRSHFVSPFAIHNLRGWKYWLLHFTKNHVGRQVYNDVLHDNADHQAHFGRSGLRMLSNKLIDGVGQLHLFGSYTREASFEELIYDIPQHVEENGGEMTVLNFYRSAYNETIAHSEDIDRAMIESPEIDIMTPKGNLRRSVKQISSNDTVKIRRQKSFYFLHPNKRKWI